MRASGLTLLLLSATAATAVGCAAPDEWNNLSGGAKEDAALAAPRQVSPLSVSLVSTARPRFRWELGEAMTGAVVELCKTRACEGGPVKTYAASGRELVVPEDLERGIWFWRLRGRAEGRVGTQPSPTWEVLVRGPAAHGESDAPTGSLLDYDGDGLADLITVADVPAKPGVFDDFLPSARGHAARTSNEIETAKTVNDDDLITFVFVYLQKPDGTYGEVMGDTVEPSWGITYERLGDPTMTITGGTDFDGDGFSDYAHAGMDFEETKAGGVRHYVDIELGGAAGTEPRGSFILLPTSSSNTAVPTLGEGGDMNNDGYSDLFIAMPDQAFTALGEHNQPGAAVTNVFWMRESPSGSPAIFGGFDANADGLTDIVSSAAPSPNTIAIAVQGAYANRDQLKTLELRPPNDLAKASTASATTFTSGDFDGDGIADLAYAISTEGRHMVCIARGDRAEWFGASACFTAAPGEELGGSLASADLEGDGQDEILASLKVNGSYEVRTLKLVGDKLEAKAVGPKGAGLRLTTIHPGRPGPARWAASAADQQAIFIFDGTELKQRLRAPVGITRGFGRALR